MATPSKSISLSANKSNNNILMGIQKQLIGPTSYKSLISNLFFTVIISELLLLPFLVVLNH